MQSEYARRRRRLMRRMVVDSVALIPAAPERTQSRDVTWPYRQDSNFLYLTGFPEPYALAVLLPGRAKGEFVLFCRERDPLLEQWNGKMVGLDGASELYSADSVFPIDRLDELMPELLAHRHVVYYEMGRRAEFDQQLMQWVNEVRSASRQGFNPPSQYRALDHDIHELRLFKSRKEIAHMREAVTIASRAHCRAMAAATPGHYEYEVEAEILYETMRHNMDFAYSSIVASGDNTCVLHYTSNQRQLQEGDLVLVDAGGMHADYAADITRTWPVSGQFTAAQREIYELVLEAQSAAIKACQSGNCWQDLSEASAKVMTRGLLHLGILKGSRQKLYRDRAYQKYMPHGIGHWIGMDVHDVGNYKVDGEWRRLKPGMVTTVEPGLYFPRARGVPKRFQGIGVRIEDNVAITRAGPDVLSAGLPSDPDEVCARVGGH